MGLAQNAVIYIAEKLGLQLQPKPPAVDDYSNTSDISLTAVIANKLATLAMQDSNVVIEGDSARAQFMQRFLDYYMGDRIDVAAEVSLGTGDCLVKPYTDGKRIGVDVIKNGDFVVCESIGNDILSCIIRAGEIKTNRGRYQRFETQMVKPAISGDGRDGTALIIYNTAFRNGQEVPFSEIEGWETIKPFELIPNVDRPLFGRYKSPAINRIDPNGVNGVKITFGADVAMEKAVEAYQRFNSEYQAKETMIFADKTIFSKDKNGNIILPNNKRNLFMQVRGRENEDLIKEFSPEIRSAELESGITVNNRMVELLIGLSPGILTPPTTSYATATEMRAALNATFAIITKFRRQLTKGTNDLLYAIDIIANRNGLSPIGEWRAQYDWSAAYVEQMETHYNQLMMAESIGAVDKAEVRSWLMDESYEESRERVKQIEEETGADLLGG